MTFISSIGSRPKIIAAVLVFGAVALWWILTPTFQKQVEKLDGVQSVASHDDKTTVTITSDVAADELATILSKTNKFWSDYNVNEILSGSNDDEILFKIGQLEVNLGYQQDLSDFDDLKSV